MPDIKIDGFGFEWDAELIGGPFDGFMDIVISLQNNSPPCHTFRIITGKTPAKKPKIGEKVLEVWGHKHIPNDTRVAVYCLRGYASDYDDDDFCAYDYQKTISFQEYKEIDPKSTDRPIE